MPIDAALLGSLFRAEIALPTAFPAVSTDTRTIQTGELFFALRGDKFDGHDFVAKALEKGAGAVVVDSKWPGTSALDGKPVVVVPDTLRALQQLARAHRRRFTIPVIAIAGSNGKTTTKELTASVLAQKIPTLKNDGSFNNHIGVPLTLLRLNSTHRAAVIEIGTNHPGEVAALCEIAEPTHGLITNIMREHMEFFGTIEGVAKAEGELFDWLAAHDGTAFVNADEPLIVNQTSRLKHTVRYGFLSKAVEVSGEDRGLTELGHGTLRLRETKVGTSFDAEISLVGHHHIQNALAAAAVGLHFGVSPGGIQQALGSQKAAKHRMVVIRQAGVTILDDTYNANPDSMLAALRTLAELPCKGRRIAALGNMGELGESKEQYHREIGEAVRALKIDGLFTTGDLAASIHETASLPLGVHCKNREEMATQLKSTLRTGDVVLLKGSRSMQLDLVVGELAK